MNRIRLIVRYGLAGLICVVTTSEVGCHVLMPLAEAPCWRYTCTMDTRACEVLYANVHVQSIPGPNLHGCFQLVPGSTQPHPQRGWGAGETVYCDRNWAVKDIGTLELRGAAWLRPRQADNLNASEEYLSITMDSAAAALYVAYDARAADVPGWLSSSDYEPLTDTAGNPLYLRIAKPGLSNNVKEVELRYYRRTRFPDAGTRFTIPGNQAGEPKWRATFPVEESAMYVVIIKPEHDLDCTAFAKRGEVVYESCGPDCDEKPLAETNAKAACEQWLAGRDLGVVCGEPKCVFNQACADTGIVSRDFGVTIEPFAFRRSSEIEFNPTSFKSEALIEVEGQSFTRDVLGTLHFEYVLDELGQMLELQINSLILKIAGLNTDVGTFSDIVIASVAPFGATCDDSSPPFAAPCNTYRIAQRDFTAGVAADVDGGTLLAVAQNANALPIQIDHVNRTFALQGGPLTTLVEVDGEDREVQISIDLTGHFVNFAPVASAIESDPGSACQEGGNEKAIHLNAAASFEVYDDPLPTAPANYEWYEDIGRATERLWGTGEQLTIPPYQLSYGVHYVTLVLSDSHGVVDMDTFPVEVFDETPPWLSVPQDIIVFQSPLETGPLSLDVGEATAWDECADQVMVSNDAPANLVFEPGVTAVTWEADDGRGNVTSGVQQVIIIPVEDAGSPLPALGAGITHLQAAAGKSQEAVAACQDAARCPVDLGSLVESIKELIEVLHRAAPQGGGQAGRYDPIVEQLVAAETALLEALRLLEESGAAGEQEAVLAMREQALDNLAAAREALDEAARRAEALAGELEPGDGRADEPGGGDDIGDDTGQTGGAPVPMGSPPPCVLTALAMGSPMAADLEVFRRFRDGYLMNNAPGRMFAATYYRLSPPLARGLTRYERLRLAGQALLAPIVGRVNRLAGIMQSDSVVLAGGSSAASAAPRSPDHHGCARHRPQMEKPK